MTDYAYDYSKEGIRFMLDHYEEFSENIEVLRTPIRDYLMDLERAVNHSRMTDRQREVVRLRYFQGRDVEDVAERLAVSPRTVQYDSTSAITEIRIFLSGVQ